MLILWFAERLQHQNNAENKASSLFVEVAVMTFCSCHVLVLACHVFLRSCLLDCCKVRASVASFRAVLGAGKASLSTAAAIFATAGSHVPMPPV